MNTNPDWWDPYSCQPYKLASEDKPRLSAQNLWEYAKVFGTALAVSPVLMMRYLTLPKPSPPPMRDMAGLSINSDPQWRTPHQEMVQEIGVRNLLIRVPVWDMQNLEDTLRYMDGFPGCEFTVNILQSRDSVLNPSHWKNQIGEILNQMSDRVKVFQIGNAVNRSKWGCRHSGEALKLFEMASEARQSSGSNAELLMSSVIDFEPLLTTRTLINCRDYKSDGCAAQLYVNRRGSPEGKQYGFFDLERKLRLVKSALALSPNTANRLWITETNWPLLDTRPYTPNSGHPRSTVDEETQAEYLTSYFHTARETGWVERVFWWQLINAGYGLVDHRQGPLRKMPSFYAFKSLFTET